MKKVEGKMTLKDLMALSSVILYDKFPAIAAVIVIVLLGFLNL